MTIILSHASLACTLLFHLWANSAAASVASPGPPGLQSRHSQSSQEVDPLREEPDLLYWHLWQHNSTLNESLTSNLSTTYHGKWQQTSYQKELDGAPVPHKAAGLLQFSLQLGPASAFGISKVQGELTLHDGMDILGLDWRMQLVGVYVNSSRRLHATVLPLMPFRIKAPNPPAQPELGYAEAVKGDLEEAAASSSLQPDYLKTLRQAAEQYNRAGAVAWSVRSAVQHALVQCSFRLELEALPPSNTPLHVPTGWPAYPLQGGAQMVGALFSDNCNVSWALQASALHRDGLHRRASRYSWFAISVASMQVILLLRQMEVANSSPSAAARISLLSIAGQALIDAYLCLLHLTFALVADTLFTEFATVAFFQFVLFALLEMRLIVISWRASRESAADIWTTHRELSALYTRFYGALLLGIFLAYQMQAHTAALLLALHSWWLPQVYHSARHNQRQPLLPSYVVGTSASRLLLPLYFYACPHNLLSTPTSPRFCAALIGWVSFQAALLLVQYKYGPRSIVPRFLLPPRYEYHRVATQRELGLGAAEVADVETGGGSRECVICMSPVEVERPPARMLTPCGHFFHADCLQRWMDVKMECPTCRTALPTP